PVRQVLLPPPPVPPPSPLSLHDALPISGGGSGRPAPAQAARSCTCTLRGSLGSSPGRSRATGPGHAASGGPLRLHQAAAPRRVRSEEHTSELQSRENLVCRLLLEKKKNQ